MCLTRNRRILPTLCLVVAIVTAGLAPAILAQRPNAVSSISVDIGSRRELFVDRELVERLGGQAELRLHEPIARELVMLHDAPWEGPGSGYHSVFKDGDRYRMYYKAWQLSVTAGKIVSEEHLLYCCYAESDDGIKWRKPELGLCEFNGSKANNIVMISGPTGSLNVNAGHPAVFKDDNMDAPAEARYKALFLSKRPLGLLAFKSADGLRWTPLSDKPIITDGAFDSQNLAFWDSGRREYRAYWRTFDKGTKEKPYVGLRSVRTATSKNFIHWENQVDLTYVDSPPEALYTNQIKPYFRAEHIFIGFPTRYVERGYEEIDSGASLVQRRPAGPDRISQWPSSLRALPEPEHREMRAAASERYGSAITEGLLMASRDGVSFKRWNEAFLRPGIERPGTWNYGHQYIAWHVVETKSALEGAPNELSIYAGESYWTGNSSAVRRYTLRLDGFVSVRAPMPGGELVTNPLRFSGRQLALNFSTSAAGSVRVEIQDLDGRALPGFALENCSPLFGDTIERAVTWKNGPDLGALAGQPVRLRFVLNDADVYAYQFKE